MRQKYNNFMAPEKKKSIIICFIFLVILCLIGSAVYIINSAGIGRALDSYRNVTVYDNGYFITKSYGQNYSDDGYYYGYKWQCVEFIKRFFYQEKNHKMPNVYGNAKDFFDLSVNQGQLNEDRALIQYKNGDHVPPAPDDLLVFTDTKYGHVAIVTEVSDTYIEIIQQNVYGKTREKLSLNIKDGNYTVGSKRRPAGWLRLE